ncbi:MAG: hypothetical protein E6J20_05570 [Chloroflexi bacterium]|nr:MAG: hypothetical protein E6J20_05570 [Chloroflexota bacterium]
MGLVVSILAVRPGGFRRQLLLAARRLRIALVLGGVFVVGSVVIRLAFRSGPVVDFGPAVLALALAVAFLFVARDPVEGRG